MAIDDYRRYKEGRSSSTKKQTASRSSASRTTRSVSNGTKRNPSQSVKTSTVRKRPTGTVKKKKRYKKYRLTEKGKKFFGTLGTIFTVGTIAVILSAMLSGEPVEVPGLTTDNTTGSPNTSAGQLYDRNDTALFAPEESTEDEEDMVDVQTYVSYYNGREYNFCTEDYVLELAEDAIDAVNSAFGEAGMNPLVPGSKNYLPEYLDKYVLAGLAMTESSFRINETDGDPLMSSANARGMCQCKEDTLDYVKWYAKSVLNVDIPYDFDDLDDPAVSMEVATWVLATNAENYFKPTRKNNAFDQAGIKFNEDIQKTMVLTSYNRGAQGVVNRLVNNGQTSSDYAERILSYSEQFRNKYMGQERQ